ncbi:HlyD family efflux transporter periplasmic adaptor subunit [Blastopirellula sp. JC732]|uniref:HlyD family efflux transporter periplasmic adaptor subunit n=1 Tax=Blastopirellula sediminis TaxID=2894196 RepID=A0A9X1SGH5_9BACT|nr:HlyD family efflux transporter periplasmic adaptor subunit [Blastopirellula sediminis]MCC9609748.1 HlyD family efflux transporter periplasmic adaptor subunit [Blastopirellula sediminis]MCC9628992.1 HlyD family efflux transporter periplasmic adaptor subunit [Blastopirellula sediminis]
MSEQSSSPASTITRVITPLAIIAAAVGIIFAVVMMRQPPKKQEVERPLLMVTTSPIIKSEEGLNFHVDGVVVPYREINLSSEVAGRITFRDDSLRAGAYVAKGQPLLEIDPRKYALEVERLTKEVEQADVAIRETDVEIENTQELIVLSKQNVDLQKKQVQRMEQLLARNATTPSQVEDEQQAMITAQNQLLQLENQVRSMSTRKQGLERAKELAQARLEQAKLDFEHTKVVSPVNGVIISDNVEQDSYVPVGSALYTIEDTSAAEVRCSLRMDELSWLWRKQIGKTVDPLSARGSEDYRLPQAPVTISYELGGRHYQWEGVLSRFDGLGLDERTRTAPVLIRVSNPDQVRLDGQLVKARGPSALLRGMFVDVKVKVQPDMPIWRVPESALSLYSAQALKESMSEEQMAKVSGHTDESRPQFVLWLVRDGKLAIEHVEVLVIQEDYALINGENADLREDDQIVITPMGYPRVGLPVKVEG